MMRRAVATLLCLALLTPVSAAASATQADWCKANPLETRKPSCDAQGRCAVPICAGEEAPLDGQLLDARLAAELGAKAQTADERVAAALDHGERMLEAERARGVALLDIERAGRIRAEAREQEALLQREPSFFEQPTVVAALSVLATILVMKVGVEAYRELR